MMRVQCPHCQSIIEAPLGVAKQAQCPVCMGVMALPDVPEAPIVKARLSPESSRAESSGHGPARPKARRRSSKPSSGETSWVLPVVVGSFILVAFVVVLLLVLLGGNKAGGQAGAPARPNAAGGRRPDPGAALGAPEGALPQGQEQAPARGNYIQLNQGEATSGLGGIDFTVSFTVLRPVPAHEQCYWIIRSNRGTLYEARLAPHDLAESGSLSASAVGAFGDGVAASFTCWIEMRRLGGFADGKRISNEIPLKMGMGRGFPGIPPPPFPP